MPAPKLTDQLQARICTLIRSGNWAYVAAEAVGIHRDTYFRWMRHGRNARKRGERNQYRKFAEAVEKAASEGEALMVEQVRKAAAEGSLDAVKWWLVHRFPDRWGLQQARIKLEEDEDLPKIVLVVGQGATALDELTEAGTELPEDGS